MMQMRFRLILGMALLSALAIALAEPSHARPGVCNRPPSLMESTEVSTRSEELRGLYYGTQLRNRLNFATNTYQYVKESRWYLFLPGNRVYSGYPFGSITRFDWEAVLRKEPTHCGTYHISSDRIRIDWQGGEQSRELSFRRFPNGNLSIGGINMEQLVSPDGLRLAATYGIQNYTSVGANGGVGSSTEITLTSDGRFTERGSVGYTGDTTVVREEKESKGSYQIRNGILELSYSDSRRKQITLALPATQARDQRPEYLMLNGVLYLRR